MDWCNFRPIGRWREKNADTLLIWMAREDNPTSRILRLGIGDLIDDEDIRELITAGTAICSKHDVRAEELIIQT